MNKLKKRNLIILHCLIVIFGFIFIFLKTESVNKKQLAEFESRLEMEKQENERLNNKYKELQLKHEKEIVEKNKEIFDLRKEIEDIVFNHIDDAEYSMKAIEPLKDVDKEQYFILYKDIKEHYLDIVDDSETIYDYYTNSQINIMQRCIETETFGCGFEAKVNVANVILNRVSSNKYPSDPIKVVTSPNQFAYGRTKISETTKLALEYAFEIEDTTNGCISFRSDAKPKTWNGLHYQFTDNVGHHFYKGGDEK